MVLSVMILFPGQGSQYVGMGKNLCESDPYLLEFFQSADQILGYSLSGICFDGPSDLLKLTENTQPAILTHSLALMKKVQNILDKHKHHCTIEGVLGHSVGEYAALVAAKSLSFPDALK